MSERAEPADQQIYGALETALRSGSLDQLPQEVTTDPQFPNIVDPYTFTPLLALAISWAPPQVVAELIDAGADPNFVALDGFPALVGAVMSGRDDNREIVEVLIGRGADLDRQGVNGWTALHAAANGDDADIVSALLHHGADPSIRTGVDLDDTALDEARRVDARRVVALLEAVGE